MQIIIFLSSDTDSGISIILVPTQIGSYLFGSDPIFQDNGNIIPKIYTL